MGKRFCCVVYSVFSKGGREGGLLPGKKSFNLERNAKGWDKGGTSKTSNSILNSTRGTRGNRRVVSLGAQTAHFDLLDWCTPNESIQDKRLSLAVSLYVLEVFSR